MRSISTPLRLSRRAVERRVARRLSRDGLVLRHCSATSRWHLYLGDYFTCRERDGFLDRTRLDLHDLAIELGVIRTGQAIAD